MNPITNLLSKSLGLTICVVGLGMQSFPASAGNVIPPGTITEWGDAASAFMPTVVPFPEGVRPLAIAAGGFQDLAITDNGLFTWQNRHSLPGKVVFPPAVTRIIAIAAGTGHNLALTDDGLYA